MVTCTGKCCINAYTVYAQTIAAGLPAVHTSVYRRSETGADLDRQQYQEMKMKKHASILTACVSGGLLCGTTVLAFGDEITPPQPAYRQTADFDGVPVSRAAQAGSIVSDTAGISVVQSRSAGDNSTNVAGVESVRNLARVAGVQPLSARSASETERAAGSALTIDLTWSFAPTRASKRGSITIDVAPLARSARIDESRPATQASVDPAGFSARQAPH
jgi:hypothetical protein